MDLPSPQLAWIDGQPLPAPGGATFATVDPSTEEVLAEVARCGEEAVDTAVAGARRAFPGWRDLAPPERAGRIRAVARALAGRAEEFARLETLDTGKPLSLARSEVDGTVRYLDYYAGLADKIHGESIPLGPGYLNYTVHEPVGVTGHIVPWNAPLNMVGRSLGPALAAGNTAVVKPAEQTPLTALRFGALCREAGLPDGVYQVVPGFGTEAGAALAAHPGIDSLTFTGSVATGRAVARACADRIRPVVLELGGKSPQLVFADADLDTVAAEVAKGIFTNTGQFCDAGSRLLVEESVREALVERLVARAHAVDCGPGGDDPDMGPLISAEQRDRVRGFLARGEAEGARRLGPGPESVPGRGYFVPPTVFTGVRPDMAIAREEIFGPVLCVQGFRDEAEAIALANDTSYGLAAGIHTRDLDRAHRLAAALEAGYVMINEYFTGGIGSPFGGWKESGIGYERGLEAVHNYTRLKNVVVRVAR